MGDGRLNTIVMRVAEKHGPMSAAAWVAPTLVPYEERRPLGAVRGDRHKTTLGLDIKDVHAERAMLPVQIAIRGEDAPTGVEVWATLRSADAPPDRPGSEAPLTADSTSGAYVSELAGQPPGCTRSSWTPRPSQALATSPSTT
ncbi:hypothetical protein [Embleya sp. NPDC059237]|uniref:hypothetical protein n=1 Tax=Embleya sp. NPDC059237 TaxID=3346784 RepID=UPI0036C45D8A